MSKRNLGQYVKIGLGFEIAREAIGGGAYNAQYLHALAERYYALQDRITPEVIDGLDKLTDSYFRKFGAPGEIATFVCGVGGAMLLASGIYNLVKNYHVERTE